MRISEAHLIDCAEYVKRLPDGYFDLLVADPPYGINGAFSNPTSRIRRYGQTETANEARPDAKTLAELFRVSKNQIVWGYNYLCDILPPTKHFIFWDKHQTVETYAAGELAYTSFDKPARVAYISANGGGGTGRDKDGRIHPMQKPVLLYKWLYERYTQPGQKVFDPYLGSGSSRIAAWDMGLDFYGCEIDKTYFDRQEARFRNHTAQLDFFDLMEGQ